LPAGSIRDPLWDAVRSFGLEAVHIRRAPSAGPGGAPPGGVPATAVEVPAVESARDGEPLESLRRSLGECRRCRLGETRLNPVFGEGNPRSGVLLVGEGPGASEDESGRPFVGRAGQLLDRILASIELDRNSCFIANVVKCRPPGNRVPSSDEIEACGGILEEQIRILQPGVIVALGATAATHLLRTRQGINSLRNRFHDRGGIPVLVTYHPAALLRTDALKRPVWDDMKRLREFMQGAGLPRNGSDG